MPVIAMNNETKIDAEPNARDKVSSYPEPMKGKKKGSKGSFNIPGTQEPDSKWLAGWFRRQWQRWRERRDLDTEIRDVIYRQSIVDPVGPNGEGDGIIHEIVRTGVAKTLLREYVGIVSGESPRFEALSDGIGPEKQRKASQVEEWDTAWYVDVGGNDLQSLVDSDAIAYGRGVSYVIWGRQYWNGFPDVESEETDREYVRRVTEWAKDAPNPIMRFHCPSPQTIFDEDEWVKLFGVPNCAYWYHRPLSEIAAAYPDSEAASRWEKQKGSEIDPQQLFVCFANRKYQLYAICDTIAIQNPDSTRAEPVTIITGEPNDWEILSSFEHGCGRNPFEILVGDTSSDPALVNKYAGLFDNSLQTIRQIDEAISQAATAVRRYGRSQLVLLHEFGPGGQLPGGVDPDTLIPRDIEWDPGRVLSLAPGEKLTFIQPDLTSYKAGMDYHDLLTRYVSRDTIDPSAWAGAASSSGYQLVTMIQTSERKLRGFVNRKCRSLEHTMESVHRLVEYIDRPISIYRSTDEQSDGGTIVAIGGWLKLSPADAKTARIRVKFAPRLDSADAAGAQIGIQLAQATSQGWLDIDKDWILSRWLGLENPERHRRAAMIQRFLATPEIQQWLTREALKDADMLINQGDAQQAEQASQLSPQQMLLAPQAMQQEMQARGLMPEGQSAPPPTPGGPPPLPVVPPNAGGAAGPSGVPPEILQQIMAGGVPPEPNPGSIPGAPLPLIPGGAPVAQRGGAGLPLMPPGAGGVQSGPAGAAGLNAVMSASALPVTPGAGQGINAPGGPGTRGPAPAQLGGYNPQSSPFGGLDLATALARFGRPRGARESGRL